MNYGVSDGADGQSPAAAAWNEFSGGTGRPVWSSDICASPALSLMGFPKALLQNVLHTRFSFDS